MQINNLDSKVHNKVHQRIQLALHQHIQDSTTTQCKLEDNHQHINKVDTKHHNSPTIINNQTITNNQITTNNQIMEHNLDMVDSQEDTNNSQTMVHNLVSEVNQDMDSNQSSITIIKDHLVDQAYKLHLLLVLEV